MSKSFSSDTSSTLNQTIKQLIESRSTYAGPKHQDERQHHQKQLELAATVQQHLIQQHQQSILQQSCGSTSNTSSSMVRRPRVTVSILHAPLPLPQVKVANIFPLPSPR